MLISSQRRGWRRVEDAAWGMAVGRFEEVSKTAGLTHLDEESQETVGRLPRGRDLPRKIRFGVMEQKYLELKALDVLRKEHADWICGLFWGRLCGPGRAKAAVREKP